MADPVAEPTSTQKFESPEDCLVELSPTKCVRPIQARPGLAIPRARFLSKDIEKAFDNDCLKLRIKPVPEISCEVTKRTLEAVHSD